MQHFTELKSKSPPGFEVLVISETCPEKCCLTIALTTVNNRPLAYSDIAGGIAKMISELTVEMMQDSPKGVAENMLWHSKDKAEGAKATAQYLGENL